MGENPNGHKGVGGSRGSLQSIGNVSASSVAVAVYGRPISLACDPQDPAKEDCYSVGSCEPDFSLGIVHGV